MRQEYYRLAAIRDHMPFGEIVWHMGDFEEHTKIRANVLDNFLKCYLRFGFNMVSYTVVPFAKAFGLSIGCKNSGRVSSFPPRDVTGHNFSESNPKGSVSNWS